MDETGAGRLKSLDSLRGVAAVVVVGQHVLLSFPEGQGLLFDEVRSLSLLGGQFAVIFFFVLSGFVLSLPYVSGRALTYPRYLARRLLRLFPPFAFAVLAAAILSVSLRTPMASSASDWLLRQWRPPLSPGVVASHLMMTGLHEAAIRLDEPIWSLIVEMRVSLILPLLVFVAMRWSRLGLVVAVALTLVCARLRDTLGETSALTADSLIGAIAFTGYYVLLFLSGATLAAHLSAVKARIAALSRLGVLGLLAVFVVAFLGLTYLTAPYALKTVKDIFCGAFATYIISLVVTFPRIDRLLCAGPLLWLGEISYSLYLIHLPVLTALVYLMRPVFPLGVTLAVAAPLMMLASHLMHFAVERPALRLGRALSQRV